MTRASLIYGQGGPATATGGIDVSTPRAGFYRTRLGQGTIRVGIRLWNGPPHDPVTGEVLDRSWRWQAEANGRFIDFDRVWPKCADDPITEAEYDRYVSRHEWAQSAAPDSAYAKVGRKHDPLSTSTPLPF
ncbi:hypothetical protein [Novosphingobium sp. FKTRR1]|uniref:hypothetical protein n=1 Tax=Novosphingobium sp. FKTRR1 TaxID=2879118 RepID=UPI001CF000EB|nr:hypothetical protein [Novosphingobium sp. FKTRR1]